MSANKIFGKDIFITSSTNATGTTVGSISTLGGININQTALISGALTSIANSNTIGNIFTTGGNVGFGTTSPVQRLDVNGNLNITGNFYQNGSVYSGSTQWGSTGANIYFNTGNVGIGTLAPSGKLHISLSDTTGAGETTAWDSTYAVFGKTGTTGGAVALGFNTASGGSLSSLSPNVAWQNMNYRALGHRFNVSNQPITSITFASSGNIGIGTTTPSRMLSLYGSTASVSSGPHIWINTSDSPTNPVFQQLNWTADNVSLNFDMYYDGAFRNSNTSTAWQMYKLNSQLKFTYQNGTAGSSNGQNNCLVLGSTGNVGIGTATPGYTLDVNGAGRIFTNGATSNFYLGNGSFDAKINLWDAPGAAWQIATGSFNLSIGNGTIGSTINTRMTISSTGNVGIGTATPGYTLDVNGGANCTAGFRVSGATGCDYRTDASGAILDAYSAGAEIRLQTQSTERVRISTTGNVGIGTSLPQTNLHIAGGGFQLGASNTAGVHMWAVNGALNVWRGTWGAGIVQFCCDSRGNFGIGTHTPTDLLHISNGNLALSSDTGGLSKGFIINQAGVWGGLEVEASPGTGNQILNMGINTNRSKTWNSSYNGGWFRVDTRGGVGIPLFQWYKKDTGGTETMMACLQSTGNFGIATASPSFTLDVNGTIARSGVKLPRFDNGSFSGAASFSIPILFNDTQYNYAEFRVRYVTSAICDINISATSYASAAMNFFECGLTTVKYSLQGTPIYTTFTSVTSGLFANNVEQAGIDNNLTFRITRATGTSTAGLRNHYQYDNVYCWAGVGTARGYGQGHIDNASVGGSPLQYITFTCSTGTVSGTYSTVHYY